MKNLFVITALAFGLHANAQDFLLGPTITYQSQAGNMLKLGGYYVQPFANNTMGFKLEANAQLAYFRNQFLAIPEGSLTYYPTFNRLIIPFVESEITPYTLTPKVGLSVATIVEIGLGYGFDIKTKENVKPINGFTFSMGFYIPLNAF
ncbi:hypothetical protein P3875_01345 [Myroides sp. JBRI-B21084]|uniref:hypothetical protein n=1 Tax=Myroides sp. JBRI-B21084 TaxID=3119977 RepID=UPI0026E2B547|nr:hypothetical protein [Paenimyroides cloacae]WKW46744.1 hypothetical protein P3875_01345 [Paenimyroides cloacae]